MPKENKENKIMIKALDINRTNSNDLNKFKDLFMSNHITYHKNNEDFLNKKPDSHRKTNTSSKVT